MIKMIEFENIQVNQTFIYDNKAFVRPDNTNRAVEIENKDVWEFELSDKVMSVVE